jgi:hypothetical protein
MRLLVDEQTIEGKSIVVPLETVVILPQTTQQCLGHLLYLLLAEGSPVEASLGSLLLEGVTILSLKDKEEALFLRAVPTAGQVIMRPQFGYGFTTSPRVLLDGLPDA